MTMAPPVDYEGRLIHENEKADKRDLKDKREMPELDPFSPKGVADSYKQFTAKVSRVIGQLSQLSSECHQLGRSYALLLAIGELHDQLDYLSLMFYNNATRLSPLVEAPKNVRKQLDDPDDFEAFPEYFERLAEALEDVRERLNEFSETTDESAKIKDLLLSFARDIRYRAVCLRPYKGQFETIPLRRYVHSLAQELGEDLENVRSAFVFFNKYGMPAIKYEQGRSIDNFLNMSTTATFFSAVTATTLQMSVSYDLSPIFSIVNTFWLCSLVLSIGAALNSLLALAWKQTTYGTRGRRLPLWFTVWIHGSAPIFLALSIGCFSAGLILFTYASHQKRYTSIITLVATAVTSFGLVSVSTWIIYEQWIAPIIPKKLSFPSRIHHMPRRRARTNSLSIRSRSSSMSDTSSINILTRAGQALQQSQKPIAELWNSKVKRRNTLDIETQAPPRSLSLENRNPLDPIASDDHEKYRKMWKDAISMVLPQKKSPLYAFSRSMSPTGPSNLVEVSEILARIPMHNWGPLSFGSISPREHRHIKYKEYGDIQDLEYSPDGQVLAITSFNEKAGISTTLSRSTRDNRHVHHMHHHGHRSTSIQVAWSPDSTTFLVRFGRHIDILSRECQYMMSIVRSHSIESATWCTTPELSVLWVEKGMVYQGFIQGNSLQRIVKHPFENLFVRDVAYVPNTELLLVVGRVLFLDFEMLPDNSRAEKQLILYDVNKKEPKSCYPILDDARRIGIANHISHARNSLDVLITYKNKTSQMWTLKAPLNNEPQVERAVYLQPSKTFTGPVHFTGSMHQMMMSVGRDNGVDIVDRESGELLYHMSTPVANNGLRGIACGSLHSGSITIAIAGLNEIKIWSLVADKANSLKRSQSIESCGASHLSEIPRSNLEIHEDLSALTSGY